MAETTWQAVALRCYRSEGRHYHTEHHIRAMLSLLAPLRHETRDAEALEAAIWFHDAVYEPTAKDNETRSAVLAREQLTLAGWRHERIERVCGLIEYTASHEIPPGDVDAALLMDLDLSILGAPPAAYDAYTAQIRSEYAHVPDPDFNVARLSFIRHILTRATIYQTRDFRDQWEIQARDNLAREVQVRLEQDAAGS
jgi:predicted metal-dependent HD superfamily phosphohydrolase